jgi:Family of unknown function (DUF5996)
VQSARALTTQRGEAWPRLPLVEWSDTLDTLRRWVQLAGKTRLSLVPPVNHWWHVTLYVTARGLGTSAMPYGERRIEVEFDFVDHNLIVRTSDGQTRALALVPRSVADFFREYVAILESLDVRVPIRPVPDELEDVIRFTDDEAHRSYDREYATRWWEALSRAQRVMESFRGRFVGKCSPVHFFWGGFDLACTRFSGRPAPVHPGGAPHLADWVVREAYSHECISAGWWPGGGAVPEPAFYSYAYPEPPGFADTLVRPDAAYYSRDLREFILPYEAVRSANEPAEMVLEFLQSTYEAGATLAGWDRQALERGAVGVGRPFPSPLAHRRATAAEESNGELADAWPLVLDHLVRG